MSTSKFKKLPIGTHLFITESLELNERGKAWYKGEEVVVIARDSIDKYQEVIVIDDGNGVRPDYIGRIVSGKQQFGYKKDKGEKLLWMTIVSCPADHPAGASGITVNGIAAGIEVAIIDVFSGTPYHTSPAGWDYVFKEFWVSFSEKCRFLMYQDAFAGGEVSCVAYFDAYEKPVNTFVIGWTRSLLEDISTVGTFRLYIKNESSNIMYGKCWICGYEKEGVYEWL